MRNVAPQDRTYLYLKTDFSLDSGFTGQLVPQEIKGITAVDVQENGRHVLRTQSGDVEVRGGWRAVEIVGGDWTFTGANAKGPAMETVPRQRQDIVFLAQIEGTEVRQAFSVDAICEMAESASGARYLTCEDGRRYLLAAGNREILAKMTPNTAPTPPSRKP